MKRDEVLKEMVRIAEALERPGLKPEQIARGMAKYEELEAQMNRIKAWEKMQEEAAAQHPESIKKSLDRIRETLAKKA